MAYPNIFATRPGGAVPIAPRAASRCAAGPGARRTGPGAAEFLLASAVLGLARGLRRRGLIGAGGFGLALGLAGRLSARGVAKWRAAAHPAQPADPSVAAGDLRRSA